MIRLENLAQFIVPLTFLAIWAITSLFNREAQPPPPRAGRPQRPDGWGAAGGAPAAGRPDARPVDREPRPARPAGPASTLGPNDAVVILEGEPRNPPVGGRGRPARPPRPTLPSKAKGQRPGPESRERQPPARRSTIEGVHRSIAGSAQVQTESLQGLRPGPALDLKGSMLSPTPAVEAAASRGTAPTLLGVTLTPEQLRREFVLAEVLFRPPVALRNGRALRLGRATPSPDAIPPDPA